MDPIKKWKKLKFIWCLLKFEIKKQSMAQVAMNEESHRIQMNGGESEVSVTQFWSTEKYFKDKNPQKKTEKRATLKFFIIEKRKKLQQALVFN